MPQWAKKVAQNAHAILTPSEFARHDLIDLLDLNPTRIHCVPYGCEHDRYHPDIIPASPADLKSLGIEGNFCCMRVATLAAKTSAHS